jgi:hypothetical protein
MFFFEQTAGGRCYLNKTARKRNYSELLRLQWLVHQGVFLMRKKKLFIQYLASMRFGLSCFVALLVLTALGFSIYFYVCEKR